MAAMGSLTKPPSWKPVDMAINTGAAMCNKAFDLWKENKSVVARLKMLFLYGVVLSCCCMMASYMIQA